MSGVKKVWSSGQSHCANIEYLQGWDKWGAKQNILDSIVNIYIAVKYPWQLRQRFIKYEDRKVQPSTRWGLAEHDQVIYRLYKEITWLIPGAQQSVDWIEAALQMLQVLWKEGKIHLGGKKPLASYSALLYRVFQALFCSSTPLQIPRKAGCTHRSIF